MTTSESNDDARDPRKGTIESCQIDAIIRSVAKESTTHRTSATPTPDAAMAESLVDRFLWLAFPGFFGPRIAGGDSSAGLPRQISRLVDDIVHRLHPQLASAFSCSTDEGSGCSEAEARERADATVSTLIDAVPEIRRLLALDAKAGFRGDPAVNHPDEAILCHPGLRALVIHRFAHELHRAEVPLLPRMLSEIAHARTGIDLHPGAQIGSSCFIDHGTGVVVGETSVIGERCTIYQGVTLGAKRFERHEDGAIRRGYRRHPTLEADVTVYAGATILGGDTIVGKGSVVNGGVFLVQSVPPGSIVSGPRLEIQLRSR